MRIYCILVENGDDAFALYNTENATKIKSIWDVKETMKKKEEKKKGNEEKMV